MVPTLRHLATHGAGFPPNPPNRRNRPNSLSVMEPHSIAELCKGLAKTKLDFKPGTSWQYSNYGFGVLGHALECAAGRPYEELLREKILEPLEMFDTKISLSAKGLERFAAQVDIAIIVLTNVGGNTAERLNGEVAKVVIKSML